jgi:hypothetical protein
MNPTEKIENHVGYPPQYITKIDLAYGSNDRHIPDDITSFLVQILIGEVFIIW